MILYGFFKNRPNQKIWILKIGKIDRKKPGRLIISLSQPLFRN
ncbi:hypothetical protein HMPREF9103_02737 [Lentilactobacillus parafarraginis F0439]|uniref:Uncharacterized protein n=1 Tax=Lentilactobacillus parafarraginis F0439 TaxID=797515 RepID=G9ZSL8_9LACO|nr:hypothetical protein HMPREF9103_02737 [Lentilactobacillus parafarraginis F0439]